MTCIAHVRISECTENRDGEVDDGAMSRRELANFG